MFRPRPSISIRLSLAMVLVALLVSSVVGVPA